MTYEGQSRPDFVDTFEEIFNRLAVEGEISQEMQIAMLLASFGDKTKSPYGHIVASLQSVQESLSWETVTARLLQEYEEHIPCTGGGSGPKSQETSTALFTKRGSTVEVRRGFLTAKGGVKLRRVDAAGAT